MSRFVTEVFSARRARSMRVVAARRASRALIAAARA
jgi:hypothetical protein